MCPYRICTGTRVSFISCGGCTIWMLWVKHRMVLVVKIFVFWHYYYYLFVLCFFLFFFFGGGDGESFVAAAAI